VSGKGTGFCAGENLPGESRLVVRLFRGIPQRHRLSTDWENEDIMIFENMRKNTSAYLKRLKWFKRFVILIACIALFPRLVNSCLPIPLFINWHPIVNDCTILMDRYPPDTRIHPLDLPKSIAKLRPIGVVIQKGRVNIIMTGSGLGGGGPMGFYVYRVAPDGPPYKSSSKTRHPCVFYYSYN